MLVSFDVSSLKSTYFCYGGEFYEQRDTGEVSPCRTCVGEPPSNQMGGDNSDRPSQDLQRTDAQGGNPHQAEPPLPQQGWWAGAAWMLDGRLEEGNPATSGDTP